MHACDATERLPTYHRYPQNWEKGFLTCSVTPSLHMTTITGLNTESLPSLLPVMMSRLYLCASAWCLLLISVNAHCPGTCCVNSAVISRNYTVLKETRLLLGQLFYSSLVQTTSSIKSSLLLHFKPNLDAAHYLITIKRLLDPKHPNIPIHCNNWLAQYLIGVVITSSCMLMDTSCLLSKSAFSVKPLPSQIVFGSGSKGILKCDYFWILSCPGPIPLSFISLPCFSSDSRAVGMCGRAETVTPNDWWSFWMSNTIRATGQCWGGRDGVICRRYEGWIWAS